jgi:predicted transcriptional regulator
MYKLTVMGEFITKKVKPLINALEVVEKNNSYWTGHDLNAIPRHLLERISELGDCILIEPDLNHIYEPSQEIIDNVGNSQRVSTFASYFNPAYLPLYVELGRKDAELSLNFTQCVWDHLSNRHSSMVEELMEMDNVSFYISKDGIKLTEISVTDKIMLLGLFDKNGKFDQQFIMSAAPGALKWGQELFDYFKRLSRQVNKI